MIILSVSVTSGESLSVDVTPLSYCLEDSLSLTSFANMTCLNSSGQSSESVVTIKLLPREHTLDTELVYIIRNISRCMLRPILLL